MHKMSILWTYKKHTVQDHMHELNAKKTITQPHVQNHQIHRPNVHCAEEIILQVTKDAKCTRTCKKTDKQINHITHRPLQQRINVNDSNQFPPINPNQTQNQMPFAPQTSYLQALNQNRQSLHKQMFNQLITQNSMILSLLNTVINKITTNR
jgi:hypothetical protein